MGGWLPASFSLSVNSDMQPDMTLNFFDVPRELPHHAVQAMAEEISQ